MYKAFSRKSLRLVILMLLPLLLTWGILRVQADTESWTDHADTAWYDHYSDYSTFTIDSPAKLAGIAKLVNEGTMDFKGKILEVDRNLNLSAYRWTPIGTQSRPFRGILIAKGGGPVSISGITVEGSYSYAGFIGNMENATVGGFALSGSVTVQSAGEAYAGGLVGRVQSTGGQASNIYDVSTQVHLNLTVTGSTYAGYAGGIAGAASGTISHAANSGRVTVTGVTYEAAAGGIAGLSEGPLTLKTVTNTSAVSSQIPGAAASGGIVGLVRAGLMMAEGHTVVTNSGSVVSDGSAAYSGGILGRLTASASPLSFSDQTTNSGSVQVNAAQSAEAYAGSLAGLIDKDFVLDFTYVNSGAVLNQAKNRLYTGGLVGRVQGNMTLNRNFTNTVAVEAAASGTEHVYTGSIAGYVDGNIATGSGSQLKNQGRLQVSGSASHVYTGGLFGSAGGTVAFGSTLPGAYANSGDLTVAGKSDVYTGGIISNRPYTKAANNVTSSGNITVTGDKALFTGGYMGKVAADSSGASLSGEIYTKTITVHGAAAQNTDQAAGIFTGGIVGLYEPSGVIDGASFTGALKATGGEYTYTGGIVGYLGAGTISNTKSGKTAASPASIDSTGHAGSIAGYTAGSIQSSVPEFIRILSQGQDRLAGRAGGIAGTAAPTAIIGSPSSPIVVRHVSVISDGALTRLGGAVGENHASQVYISMPLSDAGELKLQSSGDDSWIGGVFGYNSASLAAVNLPSIRNIKIISSGSGSRVGGVIGENSGVLDRIVLLNPVLSSEGAGSQAGLIAGRSSGNLLLPRVLGEGEGLLPKLTVSGPQSVAGGIAGVLEHAVISGNGQDATVANARISTTGERSIAGGIAGQSLLSDLESVVSDSPVLTIGGVGSTAGGIAGEATGAGHYIRSGSVRMPLITSTGADSRVGGLAGYAEVEITDPSVAAYDGEYAMIKISGAHSLAGGIAGRTKGASIQGNARNNNVENLLIHVLQAADGTTTGGAVGWNEATPIRSLYGTNVKITDSAPNSMAGGLAGYHKGAATAGVADNYMSEIHMTAGDSSVNSTLGGVVGLNDARDGGMDNGDPRALTSSVQNNRSLGSLTVNASRSRVGGLAGENRSVIANTSISDGFRVVSQGSENTVGGLVGLNAKTVYYSFSHAALTLGGSQTAAGGLVGENTGSVSSSYVHKDLSADISGTETGYGYLGGLIGKNSGTVERSYASSAVTSNGTYVNAGGLVGWQNGGSMNSSYAAGNVRAQGASSFAGGFFGRITGGTAKDSYSAGQVTGEAGAYAGAFAGRYDTASKELLENNYYVKDEGQGINSGLLDFAAGQYYELKLYQRLSPILSSSLADREAFKALSGWDFSSQNRIWKYGSPNAEYRYPELVLEAGSGGGPSQPEVNISISWYTQHKDEPRFFIGTEAELAGLAAIVNGSVTGLPRFDFAGRVVELTAPIRIQSAQWTPIGSGETLAFQGSFDGKDYLISGLRVDKPEYSGLFGVVGSRATVSRTKLEPVLVTGAGRVGALAALNQGLIDKANVAVRSGGSVSGGMYTGGVTGESQGILRNAAVTVGGSGEIRSTTAGAAVGGVVGSASAGSLTDTVITLQGGTIKGSGLGSSTGGAVGRSGPDHAVSGVRLTAGHEETDDAVNITGSGHVGGLIGAKSGKAAAVWDIADVSVEQAVLSSDNGGIVGGIVGSLEKSALRDGLFKGNLKLSVDGASAGGIAGRSLDSVIYKGTAVPGIVLSTSSGESFVGGIAGIVETTADTAFDFGKLLPLYRGITLSKTEGGTIQIAATGHLADISAGGIAGVNRASSLYNVSSTTALEAAGARMLNLGGIIGWNRGELVSGHATSAITASDSSIYHAGGVAGLSTGGRMIYAESDAGSTLDVGSAAANPGVTPAAHTGGFIGKSSDTIIRNSSSEAKVRVASDNPYETLYTGGFAGLLESGGSSSGSVVEQAYAKSSVTVTGKAGSYAGGFAGDIGPYTVREAYASGSVSNTAFDARSGGFVGVMDQGALVEKAYAASNSVEAIGSHGATRAYAGGFAGYNNGSLTEIYAAVKHTASLASGSNSYAGSFIGYNFRDGRVNRSYYEGELAAIGHGTPVQGLAPADLTSPDGLTGWNFAGETADWAYLEGSNGGKPVLSRLSSWAFAPDLSFLMDAQAADEVTIANERQLGAAVLLLNDSDLSFYRQYHRNADRRPVLSKLTLGRDMQLSGALWIPFEEFSGVWDGGGYTITGLSFYGKDYDSYGFVRINKGTIRNLSFADARIQAGSKAGVVAGINEAQGVLSHIRISGKVTGSGDYAGGAAGISSGTLGSITTGGLEVTGRSYVGGIVGKTTADINGAVLTGMTRITASGSYAGAVAGSAKQVSDVQAADLSVTAGSYAGGVAGETTGLSTVETGQVTVKGSDTLGGMAGAVTGPINGIRAASVNVEAVNGAAAGIVPATAFAIEDVKLSGVSVQGSGHVGGIAGTTTADIRDITLTGTARITATGEYAGAIAGSAKQISNIRADDISVAAAGYAGGIAGEAAGISQVELGQVTVKGGGNLGGMAGAVTGPVRGIRASGVTVNATDGTAAGVVPVTGFAIEDVELSGVDIKGSAYVGGITGKTTAAVVRASVQGELLIQDGVAGGIAGRNEGSIGHSRFNGMISGGGTSVGGVAGDNLGSIQDSYAQGSLGIQKNAGQVKLGGIAGSNGPAAVIERSFSAAELRAKADAVSAGGIAGETEGSLYGVLNAGPVEVSGLSYVRAGGIAGVAPAGSIRQALSHGQVEGRIQGLLVYKKTLIGGIAGQAGDKVSVEHAYGDRQMLGAQAVYNDSDGHAVRAVPGKAMNLKTGELVQGTLYEGLDRTIWQASSGFYPRLAAFGGTDAAKVAAAAVVLSEQDTAYQVKSSYTLTDDPSLVWSTVNREGEIRLTAALRHESKTISLNKQPLRYADTAQKPTGLADSTFKETAILTLSTSEPGGNIYYTLDGSQPTEESPRYGGPVKLTQTTTVKAIVVAEGRNDSDTVQAVYTKEKPSTGGGGGGFGGGLQPAGSTANILVNGKAESAGRETTVSKGGRLNTIMTLQEEALKKLLQDKGELAEVTVVFDKKSDLWTTELSGTLIREMASRKASLRMDTAEASYRIPAVQLTGDAKLQSLSKQAGSGELQVRIEIAALEQGQAAKLKQAAARQGYVLAGSPISFKATYLQGDRTGELEAFAAYTERTLKLPADIKESGAFAGVSMAPDGAISAVPSETRLNSGKKAVVIRSTASSGLFAAVQLSEASFRDTEQHWAQEAIRDLGSRWMISGTGEGLFEPDRSMTRAEFAAIAVKALGLSAPEQASSSPFSDVNAAEWYAPYIQTAYAYGLITGHEDGSFGPQATVSREQATAIIARAMRLAGLQADITDDEAEQLLAGFADAGRIADYAKGSIAAGVKAGLISGKGAGVFAPADPMIRAEVATILQKLLRQSGLIG